MRDLSFIIGLFTGYIISTISILYILRFYKKKNLKRGLK